jgi:hypothetical protein
MVYDNTLCGKQRCNESERLKGTGHARFAAAPKKAPQIAAKKSIEF